MHTLSIALILSSSEIEFSARTHRSLMQWLQAHEQKLSQDLAESQTSSREGMNTLSDLNTARDHSNTLVLRLRRDFNEVTQTLRDSQGTFMENNRAISDALIQAVQAGERQSIEHRVHSDMVLRATDQIQAGIESIQYRQITAEQSQRALQIRTPSTTDSPSVNDLLRDISDLGTNLLATLLRVTRTLLR